MFSVLSRVLYLGVTKKALPHPYLPQMPHLGHEITFLKTKFVLYLLLRERSRLFLFRRFRLTLCDGRGHLINHLLEYPSHTKLFSYKLQRQVR